jgi:hypothetical protein
MVHFIKKVGGVLPLEEIEDEDENESFVLSTHSSAFNFAPPKRLKAKLLTFGKKKSVTIPEGKMAKLRAGLFEHEGVKREVDLGLNHLDSSKLVATLLPELFGPGGIYNNHSTEKVSIQRIL